MKVENELTSLKHKLSDYAETIQHLQNENFELKQRMKELEEEIGYIKNNKVYEVKRLFDDPEKEIKRLLSHLDISIAAGRTGWKRAEQLEEGIRDAYGRCECDEELYKLLEK